MNNIPCLKIIGMKVNIVKMSDVIGQMEAWIIQHKKTHYITVNNAHSAIEFLKNNHMKKSVNNSDLSVPDGTPLVWIARYKGHPIKKRVYGPGLMLAFCEGAASKGYKNYFFGGAEGVSEELEEKLCEKFPGLKVVGTHSPPFRPLTEEEDKEIVEMINNTSPDVLWVGLGCPKQEIWMYEHKDRLKVPVIVGVGAAFDFHTGRVKQAPRWMQDNGLEWLYRLVSNPKRLWKRYMVYGPIFVFNVILELTGLKRYP